MALRVLIDENTSPRIVERLREAGHEATHVLQELGDGAEDSEIVAHAEQHDYAIVTHDDDFLLSERTARVRVLYYDDDTIPTDDLADTIIQLGSVVRTNRDLAEITYLGQW